MKAVYRLYRWAFTPWGLALRPPRGSLLGRYSTFKELVSSATRRARMAGYYEENDWQFLFDWDREDMHGKIKNRPTRNGRPPVSDRGRNSRSK